MLVNKNKVIALTLVATSFLALTACGEDKKEQSQALQITKDTAFDQQAAYAVGASVGAYIVNLKNSQKEFIGELDNQYILQGFNDALQSKAQMENKAIEQTLVALDQKVQEQMQVKAKALAQKNLDDGNKFLAENAKKEGVKTTESGLQYKVITQGKGAKPKKGDIVQVKYKGSTIDGKVFDEQKEPVELALENLLPGWIEGVMMMPKGSKYELYIPANLAYGANGAGQVIAPNSALIFEIELVDFKAPNAKDSAKK